MGRLRLTHTRSATMAETAAPTEPWGAFAISAVALYLPATQLILSVEPIEIDAWLRLFLVASSINLAMELHEALRRRWPA